jgi:hypothetical protein
VNADRTVAAPPPASKAASRKRSRSVTEISPSGSEPLTAYGTMAHFIPPPSSPATPPSTALEVVADYLLIAYDLIEQDGAKEMLGCCGTP